MQVKFMIFTEIIKGSFTAGYTFVTCSRISEKNKTKQTKQPTDVCGRQILPWNTF